MKNYKDEIDEFFEQIYLKRYRNHTYGKYLPSGPYMSRMTQNNRRNVQEIGIGPAPDRK